MTLEAITALACVVIVVSVVAAAFLSYLGLVPSDWWRSDDE